MKFKTNGTEFILIIAFLMPFFAKTKFGQNGNNYVRMNRAAFRIGKPGSQEKAFRFIGFGGPAGLHFKRLRPLLPKARSAADAVGDAFSLRAKPNSSLFRQSESFPFDQAWLQDINFLLERSR